MTFLRQTLSVARKDLRHLRPFVLAVGAVMALMILGEPGTPFPTPLRLAFPMGLVPLALALLAIVIVQQDPPADDRAFWATRPLRPGAVLLAKGVVVVVVLGCLPLAVEAIWFRTLGVGDSLPAVVADSAVSLGSILALASAAAALGRSLRGSVGIAAGAWIGVALLEAISAPETTAPYGVRLTQAYLQEWTWLVLGGVVVAHAYLTGRWRRTAVVGSVALLVATPALKRVPFDLSHPAPVASEPDRRRPYPDADAVALELEALEGEPAALGGGGEARLAVRANLRLRPAPATIARLTHQSSRLRGPGLDRSFELYDRDVFNRMMDPHFTSLEGAGSPLGPPRRGGPPLRVLVAAGSESELAELAAADHLEVELSFDVFRPKILGRMNVEAGASFATPSRTFVVLAVRRTPRSLVVEVGRRWEIRRPLRRTGADTEAETITFALRSRAYDQYLLAPGTGGGGKTRGLLGGSRLVELTSRLDFTTLYATADGPSLPDDWFEDVELVMVGPEYVGSFTRIVEARIAEWPGVAGRVPVEPQPLTPRPRTP